LGEKVGVIRKFVRNVAPPILVYYVKKAIGSRGDEYLPEGWSRQVKGWMDESVRQTQLRKWPQFLTLTKGTKPLGIYHEAIKLTTENLRYHNIIMSYAYVLAVAAGNKNKVSVLDWGSSIGHYYVFARALFPNLEFDYFCRDTALLCSVGRRVLPEVKFYDNDEEWHGRQFDLVLCCGALQYIQDWRALIQKLAAAAKPYLFITNIPVVDNVESFPVLQRPGSFTSYDTEFIEWFFNRNDLLDFVASLKMDLVREFLAGGPSFVRNAPEEGPYRGFLFKKHD
jgi:putative methyltransferase (TIGR04325 family)